MLRKLKPGIPELLVLEIFFALIALSFYRFFTLSKWLETTVLFLCAVVSALERDRKIAIQNAVLLFAACSVWYGAVFSPSVNNNEHPKFVIAGAVFLTLALILSVLRAVKPGPTGVFGPNGTECHSGINGRTGINSHSGTDVPTLTSGHPGTDDPNRAAGPSVINSHPDTDAPIVTTNRPGIAGLWGVIIISALFLIFSISSLSELPILDSGAYYGWMRRIVTQFDFTFREMPYYCFYDHLSPGYGILVLIGELWNGGTGIGLHAVNLILTVISVFAFYDLTGKIMSGAPVAGLIHRGSGSASGSASGALTPAAGSCGNDDGAADHAKGPQRGPLPFRILITACYAFHPAVLGLSGNISLDLPLIPLSILVVWTYLTGNEILFAFVSWIFVLTKEPAVIYYFLMCAGILIYECRISGIAGFIKKRFISLLSGVSAGLWWMVYYLAPGRGAYGMAGELFISEGEDMHGFGFTMANLAGKAAQFFILDYNWLLFILAAVSVFIIIKQKIRLSEDAMRITVLCSSLSAGIFLFNIFYIDYMHPRYMLVFEAPLLLLSAVFLSFSGNNNRTLVAACLAVLLFSQSFACTDMLTRKIIFRDDREIASAPFSSFGDGKVYNRESSYPVKAVEKALLAVGYKDGERVAVPGLDLTGDLVNDGRIVFSDSGETFVKDTGDADIMIIMPWQSPPQNEAAWSECRYATVTVRYARIPR
ncbi:MAG: hypothetical protein IJT00_07820 [Lachnospiraceae bacterium]|nr:hypothetical protein [Lachnospiraceae bacterium]